MIVVDLNDEEWAAAVDCGLAQRKWALEHGCKDRHGLTGTPEQLDEFQILGCAAEIAAAKVIGGVQWQCKLGEDLKKDPDIEPDWDVRRRKYLHYQMMVRKDDRPYRKMVHVIGSGRRMCVVGWKWTSECQRDEWEHTYGNRPPAWFVPLNQLNLFGRSPYHPESLILGTEQGMCLHCREERQLIIVHRKGGDPRVDCGWCNRTIGFRENY